MFTEQRIEEILNQLSKLRYPQEETVTGWRMERRNGETKPSPSDDPDTWQPVPESGVWGGHLEYVAFAANIEIPASFQGKPVEFSLTTGKEGQWDATNPQFSVYIDGALRQGFDVNHRDIRLTSCAKDGERYSVFLSAYTGVQNFHLLFQPAIRTVDLPVEAFYYDLLVPFQTACLLEKEETQYIDLITVLNQTVNLLDLRKPGSDSFYQSVEKAGKYLKENLYDQPSLPEAVVRCVGHTHIDVAWLWTLSVTEDKALRSFSTVLELMRRYPEYRFMSSQPQLYQYVKRNGPKIYEQIKERVAQGRWETEGGMFVEADCNLASGESLVRQFLYGKRFFKEEFGKDNVILWLPDVFGYSAALPQIMEKCGIRYFMTTKISWNEYNQMPYDTFYWKGIDGTQILTHFIPTRDYASPSRTQKTSSEHTTDFTTYYNGSIHPCQIKGAWQRYQQKHLNREVLCSYGYGDGGGGPTIEMLETEKRLAQGISGCPVTKQSTAREFFEKLEADVQGKKVPIWSGELYLEYHRATYTSMARNKKYNRRSEFAMTNLEGSTVLAHVLCDMAYPEHMQENWEILLRNQFHDILPGSAIYEVYEDSRREYEQLLTFAKAEDEKRKQAVADGVGEALVFNDNGQSISGFVRLSQPGNIHNTQKTADGEYLAWADQIPAKGYRVLRDEQPKCGRVTISLDCVDTPYATLRIDEKGHIVSWYDKTAGRQILKSGSRGNVLMTYEDKPHIFDNWNLFDYYKEKSWPVEELVSAKVVEEGPYRWALDLTWQYQDTTIGETMYFYGNSPRVDIRFTTDWKEEQIFLKALFPLDLNTTEATFEIQYGNVKRPTTYNTSWDQARFEVCCHKWMDVSEGDYGISFLNDCKYGVSVEENVVGLSLIKSGKDPNPMADREPHQAVYSVLPHIGSWKEAGIVKEAYLLNNPLKGYVPGKTARQKKEGKLLPEEYGFVTCEARNLMIEVIKKAEDGEDVILRLYEFENTRTQASLTFAKEIKQVWLCDMLENKQKMLARQTSVCTFPVKPFEIITLRVKL